MIQNTFKKIMNFVGSDDPDRVSKSEALCVQMLEEMKMAGYQTEDPCHLVSVHKLNCPNVDPEMKKFQIQIRPDVYEGIAFKEISTGKLFGSVPELVNAFGNDFLCIYDYSTLPYSIYVKEIDAILMVVKQPNGDTSFEFCFRNGTVYKISSYENSIVNYYSSWGMIRTPSFAKAFCEMFNKKDPFFCMKSMDYVFIDTPTLFVEINKAPKMAMPKSKNQEKINSFVENYPVTNNIDNCNTCSRLEIKKKIIVETLDDDLTVIRWIMQYQNYSADYFRIYVNGNSVYPCKRNNEEQFIYMPISKVGAKNFEVDASCEFEFIEKANGMLQYYKDIVNQVPENARGAAIVSYIADPHFEQMCKLGYSNIFTMIFNSNTSIENALKKFWRIDKRQKQFFKWIGFNKNQLDYIYENFDQEKQESLSYANMGINELVDEMKMIANIDCLNDMDFENFKILFHSAFNRLQFRNSRDIERKEEETFIDRVYQIIQRQNIPEGRMNFIKSSGLLSDEDFFLEIYEKITGYKIMACHSRYQDGYRFYSDYIKMVYDLGATEHFNVLPKTSREVAEGHSAITTIYNLKKDEINNEKFVAQLGKIVDYQYSDDSRFQVVIPSSANDLAIEGVELHHCVKSYIDKVINGQTNIVFIREKKDLNKPFFTVEVDNNRAIQQVHGMNNCCADSVPGLLEFINDWAKDKKLRLCYIDKVR